MRKILPYCLIALTILMAACRKEIGGTNVRIKDPVRHYLPVLQGDELQMMWWIYNDGPNPLIITDVLPACSTIQLVSTNPALIPSGDSALMVFIFHSEENINLARHTIRIFGNILPDGVAEMQFDVSVVRPTPNHTDFEERLLKKVHDPRLFPTNTRRNNYTTDSLKYQ